MICEKSELKKIKIKEQMFGVELGVNGFLGFTLSSNFY